MSHIIIIGAGISGLMAATKLLEKQHTVTVVEARDRIGGRIHTLEKDFTQPVEAGAEFVHGKQPLTLSLLQEAGGKQVLRKGNHFRLSKGELDKGDIMDDQWGAFLNELGNLKTDVTLDDFVQRHFSGPSFEDLRHGVKQFAQGFDIADTTRVSAMALHDEWSHTDEDDQYHVEGGYKTLIDFLKTKVRDAGGQIITGSPVEEVRWKRGAVAISITNGKTLNGDKVIITVPLGVLQRGAIRFSPALPMHEQAFRDMGFGGVVKFLMEFKEPFWESGERAMKNVSFIFSDADVPTWWTPSPVKTPLITGWLGGPPAVNAEHETQDLFERSVKSLAYIFKCPRNVIKSQLSHWHIADWVVDPFSLGAYSYPTLHTKRALEFLTKAVEETIYFSGEAYYEGASGGTVEAALSSGIDVSLKI